MRFEEIVFIYSTYRLFLNPLLMLASFCAVLDISCSACGCRELASPFKAQHGLPRHLGGVERQNLMRNLEAPENKTKTDLDADALRRRYSTLNTNDLNARKHAHFSR